MTGAARVRIQPLLGDEAPHGWLVLCRDLTEVRSRERQLVRKDATI